MDKLALNPNNNPLIHFKPKYSWGSKTDRVRNSDGQNSFERRMIRFSNAFSITQQPFEFQTFRRVQFSNGDWKPNENGRQNGSNSDF